MTILSAQWESNSTTRLRQRHPCTSGVEDDQYKRFAACHFPMECGDCLGNRLSRGEALPLAIFLSLKGQFSGDDVRSTWHRMTMPFQLSVWRENDFQY